MKTTRSTKVPKGWEAYFAHITDMTNGFCHDHLNAEYAELARHAIAALCRKRPSPLSTGGAHTWACAVFYALGQVNFLSDKASKPYMTMADLAGHFGVAPSTAANKAKLVRKALGMHQFGHEWALPSRVGESSIYWLIQVDGWTVDARTLPLDLQQIAADRGLIPYAKAASPDAAAGPDDV